MSRSWEKFKENDEEHAREIQNDLEQTIQRNMDVENDVDEGSGRSEDVIIGN